MRKVARSAPFFGPSVVVFLLALHHHRCLHRHCLRLLQRLGPAGESEEHQVDDGPPKGGVRIMGSIWLQMFNNMDDSDIDNTGLEDSLLVNYTSEIVYNWDSSWLITQLLTTYRQLIIGGGTHSSSK